MPKSKDVAIKEVLLPGFKPEDVQVSVYKRRVTIIAESTYRDYENFRHRKEIHYVHLAFDHDWDQTPDGKGLPDGENREPPT